jgi:multiple sugar transport system ATP-binding protein
VAAVTLDNVVKVFGNTVAVDRLCLEIRSKEFVVLLGPSGCGKTTTLNMIAGLEAPSAGRILFDGRPVEHVPAEMRDVSMVFQSIALYPHMTVYGNIAFPLKMAKRPKTEIDARVRGAAALLRIEGLLGRRPHQLSGGQRQRVALGRAVVRDPAAFLFDEPLSALDARLRVDMRLEIKKLHERLAATFVYVTHDQVEALTLADRIAVMDGGRLQQFGTPDEIYQRPVNTTVASFVGSPSMNFLEGDVRRANGTWRFESTGISMPLSGAALHAVRSGGHASVTLGIRPERAIVDGSADAVGIGWVYATEPVGSDLFVDLSFDDPAAGDQRLFKVRTRPELSIRAGDRVPVALPQDYVYLFDGAGRRIHPQDQAA